MSRKSSTLLIATTTSGPCRECRHANQGTVDFSEGILFCWFAKASKRATQQCDVAIPLFRSISAEGAPRSYYIFEPFRGDNGTYGVSEDLRILAEDADPRLRASLRADEPLIPGDG
ncbi:MAG: hypothetical protein AAF721_02565 [Myxococcota bacterium]